MEIPNRFTRLPQDLEKKATDLDSLFTELYHTGRFNGNVLAAEKGRVFFHRSFGYADMEQEIPLTPNSIFDIGSISKQFTAAAIMLLEQERALNYDDYACTYLPEIPYKDITIRHLLTHTSGLPDYVDFSNVEYDPEKQFTNRYIIDLLLQQNPILNFTPGDNWSYSNLGYLLLAQIVQNISGKSLHDYLKLNLFEPAGMNYTAHKDNINESMESFRTKGYIFYLPTQGPEVAVELPDPEINYPARNATAGPAWINSCTIDLYLWDRMLYTEKILTNANLEQAFAQIILNNGEAYDYGFGWFCYRDNDDN
ncbi:MAG: beta-lactamase family protein, partial [Candidatus Cloacimonetes bacterium]|nr:beta-lactamase family protein [Candidatus Cloacimonadota bacterium]